QNPKSKIQNLKLRDSKRLSPRAREKFYKILTTHPGICWGVARVSERLIDKINILEATKLAMKRVIERLKTKNKKLKIDFLIVDGKMKLNIDLPQKAIIKADEKVFSCACASIIAKVKRDAIMKKYAKKFPQYDFAQHKGYPTKKHLKMLKKYGPCQIHRKSFISQILAC
ncbi:MAG: ribonuclease HII, partial [Patescibacteria group bacterium]|nr:ribonuclease HII [Patescibacteria group bacterium]